MNNTQYKSLIFLLSAGLILLMGIYFPFLSKRTAALQVKPLAGSFSVTERPTLSIYNWLKGTFQKDYTAILKEDPDMRPLFVRIRNEMRYQLFNTEAHPVLEIGKGGYFFDKTYIRSSLGMYFRGEEFAQKQADLLGKAHQYLKSKGKELLVLLPPAKAAHILEKVPAAYDKFEAKTSDRMALLAAFREKGITCMDFEFLRNLEDQTGLPMYPQAGLHWSLLGATYAADSMSKTIENLLGIQMPKMQFDELELTTEPRDSDEEFGRLMNVLSPIRYDTIAYPTIRYESDTATTKPKVLILGDSYYRVFYDMGIQKNLFHPKSQYWHYFEKHIAPEHEWGAKIKKDPVSLRKVLDEIDIVLYVASETNAHRLGFGFTEAILSLK